MLYTYIHIYIYPSVSDWPEASSQLAIVLDIRIGKAGRNLDHLYTCFKGHFLVSC